MAMKVFRFDVDETYARKNNELLRDTRRVRLSAFLLAALFVAGAVAAVAFIDTPAAAWILAGVLAAMAVAFVAVGIVVPRKVGSPAELYASYPLAPAIVAEVNARDVVLMALVNTNVDPDREPTWALALRTVTRIEGHRGVKGERVPVAAVYGRRGVRDQSQWLEVTPMPIAWGTPDGDVVAAAIRAIPDEQWRKLNQNKHRLSEVQDTRNDLLTL